MSKETDEELPCVATTPSDRFAARVVEIIANTGGNAGWKVLKIREAIEQMEKEPRK